MVDADGREVVTASEHKASKAVDRLLEERDASPEVMDFARTILPEMIDALEAKKSDSVPRQQAPSS
jgi:hypothetical protein